MRPALDPTKLFPLDLMASINTMNFESLQTKALLKISSASHLGHRDGQGRGGRRNLVRRDPDRPYAQRCEDGHC